MGYYKERDMKKLFLVANSLIFWYMIAADRPMRLYSFYTPSHEIFKNQWFLPTLQDDYEVIIHFDEQQCESARYCHKGWKQTTLKKVEHIIEAVKENMGDVFVYFDIDIQFFGCTRQPIEQAMHDKDLVFQRDAPSGAVCSGCFACRASEKTRQYWQAVRQYMLDHDCSDQEAVNALLRLQNAFNLIWEYLPTTFFGGGTLTGKQWQPGKTLSIPHHIILHHANWTYGGIEHKIKQLEYVRKKVERRRKADGS